MLKAAPGQDLYALNGLNVGAGGRPIHPTLLGIDAHRGLPENSGGRLLVVQVRGTTWITWRSFKM